MVLILLALNSKRWCGLCYSILPVVLCVWYNKWYGKLNNPIEKLYKLECRRFLICLMFLNEFPAGDDWWRLAILLTDLASYLLQNLICQWIICNLIGLNASLMIVFNIVWLLNQCNLFLFYRVSRIIYVWIAENCLGFVVVIVFSLWRTLDVTMISRWEVCFHVMDANS